FMLLWIGQGSNAMVLWMDLIARPILVIALTGSAVQLGLVSMARGIPMLVLSPYAGVLADRIDRRRVLLASKGMSMVLYGIFVALILTGSLELWHVYVTALAKSSLNAFDQPARHALLPSLIPRRLLMNAVALLSGTMQISRLGGAAFAGFLIGLWALAFGLQEDQTQAFGGVYLIVSIMSVAAFSATYPISVPLAGRPQSTTDSWFTSLMEGLRYARRSPVIMGVLLLFAIQSAFGMPYQQVFVPWLAIEVLDIGPGGAGMLIAVASAGSFASALMLATWGHLLRNRGWLILTGLVVFGLALAALGFSTLLSPTVLLGLTVPILPMIILVFVGLAQNALMTIKNGLLLETTPNELRGR
ncbi:MAG: MFS transporter, partial [Dehalococcoidia bacterium]